MAVGNVTTYEELKEKLSEGFTYEQISLQLQTRSASNRGLSSRSIRRYCRENGLGRNCTLNDQELTQKVFLASTQVIFSLMIINII